MSKTFARLLRTGLFVFATSVSCRDATQLTAPAETKTLTTTLTISVEATGEEMPGQFVLLLDDQRLVVSPNVAVKLTIIAGPHAVAITSITSNCDVAGDARQVVTAIRGQDVPVHFSIKCVPHIKSLEDRDVVFVRDRDLFAIRSDGTGLVQITDAGPAEWYFNPSWSHDGRRLAFTKWSEGTDRVLVFSSDSVTAVSTVAFDGVMPTWSNSDDMIAYARAGAIYVTGLESPATPLSILEGTQPAWAPHEGRLAYVREVTTWDDSPTTSDIFIYDIQKGTDARLTNASPTAIFSAPAWSPDGQHLALSVSDSHACDASGCGIAIMNTDGSNLHIITPLSFSASVAWAPDARRIAFGGTGGIYVVNDDGSDLHLLAPNGFQPTWRKVPQK